MITRKLAYAALAAALLPAAAYAANISNTGNSNANVPHPQALPQQITKNLEQEGFSDVKVEPGSFIVTAKDKNNNPVEMLIRPNSMLIMAAENNSNNGPANNTNTTKSTGTSQ